MKKIKILSLLLALIMVVFAFASCKKDDQSNTTTTTTTEDNGGNNNNGPTYLADPIQIDINFDGVSSMEDISIDENFSVNKMDNVTFENGALKLGYDETAEKKSGLFNINDDYLTIDESYELMTITAKLTLDKLPDEGEYVSLVSPIYYGKPYTSYDAAGNSTEHTDGFHAQFFLKVDSQGKVYYYDPLRWFQSCPQLTDDNGEKYDFVIEVGKTYDLKIEFCLDSKGTDSGKYVVYLDETMIADYACDYVYNEGDTTKFYVRFGDANRNFKMTVDDISIAVTPKTK